MSGDFKGISGWQKISLIDYPGTVSTVLFFEGCNLRCPYCHNPDIVLRKLPQIPWSEISSYLIKRKGIIDGVVLSGGEPTLHSVLPDMVEQIHGIGLRVKIDTNGSNPDMIKLCKPDYLALDLKTDINRYAEIGCKDSLFAEKFMQTMTIVRTMGLQAEVRITIASPFIDENVIEAVTNILNGVQKVFLQPLKITRHLLDESFGSHNQISTDNILKFKNMISPFVGKCIIRGEE